MLRKLLILGVCAGTSASIPILYESNRETVHKLLKAAAAKKPEATAAAQAPQAASGILSGRKVQIAPDARGHFLADFKVNGRRVAAMVDTGATYVVLNRSTARSLGIALNPADFKYKVDTANGTTHAASARLADVNIGRIHVENVEAAVLEDSAIDDVLIGMSFLKRLDRYAVENNALVLVQ